jgi:hypothetical protein
MPLPLPTSEVASPAELQHYAVERRRDRGLLGRRRGTIAFFVVLLALSAAGSLLERGDVVLGLGLGATILLLEVVFAVVHHTRPERTPIIDVIEGTVSIEEESDVPHGRWFVGEQRVHLPPHWSPGLPEGQHVRLRVARPPGEAMAFALAIEGRYSADFERARGLPPAPANQPVLLLVLATALLIVGPGLLIGGLQFAFGSSSPRQGLAALSAMAASPAEGTVADFEAEGLPDAGRVRVTDATVLPLKWIVDAPEDAGWAVLSEGGRARVAAQLEAQLGRKVGGIPKPDEPVTPVALATADVLAWRRVDLHESDSDTGRPGNQVMVWLARRKPFDAVRVDGETTLRGPTDAENLAFATGALLLALLALPALLVSGVLVMRSRVRSRTFDGDVSRAYTHA